MGTSTSPITAKPEGRLRRHRDHPGANRRPTGRLQVVALALRECVARRGVWFHAGMEVVEFGTLTEERRRSLEGDERDPFDAAGIGLHFRPKQHHVGLQDESGRLVASTGMVEVDVEVDGERFPVVGLGGVIVSAPYRGRGLARSVVEAALVRARRLGPRFAILFCHENRAGLYRRLGFAAMLDNVLVQQPSGYAAMTQQTMWIALHSGATWPPGEIIVHSLPF